MFAGPDRDLDRLQSGENEILPVQIRPHRTSSRSTTTTQTRNRPAEPICPDPLRPQRVGSSCRDHPLRKSFGACRLTLASTPTTPPCSACSGSSSACCSPSTAPPTVRVAAARGGRPPVGQWPYWWAGVIELVGVLLVLLGCSPGSQPDGSGAMAFAYLPSTSRRRCGPSRTAASWPCCTASRCSSSPSRARARSPSGPRPALSRLRRTRAARRPCPQRADRTVGPTWPS